jgi:hypothetical protein
MAERKNAESIYKKIFKPLTEVIVAMIFSSLISLSLTIYYGDISLRNSVDLFALSIILGFMAVLISLTVILKKLERGPSKIASLKGDLQTAFLRALDNSSLNPNKPAGDKHERHGAL